jgi:hypothetical protein
MEPKDGTSNGEEKGGKIFCFVWNRCVRGAIVSSMIPIQSVPSCVLRVVLIALCFRVKASPVNIAISQLVTQKKNPRILPRLYCSRNTVLISTQLVSAN